MKIKTFNHIACTKILKHTVHQEQVLEARDIYLASESIEQANHSISLSIVECPTNDFFGFIEYNARFTKEREVIKFHIDGLTYRISGNDVTVEYKI